MQFPFHFLNPTIFLNAGSSVRLTVKNFIFNSMNFIYRSLSTIETHACLVFRKERFKERYYLYTISNNFHFSLLISQLLQMTPYNSQKYRSSYNNKASIPSFFLPFLARKTSKYQTGIYSLVKYTKIEIFHLRISQRST